MIDSFIIRPAHWQQDRLMIRRVREEVFVIEQSVPADLEWDGRDHEAAHVLAETVDPISVRDVAPSP